MGPVALPVAIAMAIGGACWCLSVLRQGVHLGLFAVIFVGSTVTSVAVGRGNRSVLPVDVLVVCVAGLLLLRSRRPFGGLAPDGQGERFAITRWPYLVAGTGLMLVAASPHLSASVNEAAAYVVLGAYCFVGRAAAKSVGPDGLRSILLGTFVLQAVLALSQLLAGDPRVVGAFALSNQLGALVVLIVPMALYYWLERRSWVWIAVLFLALPVMLGSGSRAGLIVAVLAGVAYVFLRRRSSAARTTRRAGASRIVSFVLVGACVLPMAIWSVQRVLPRWQVGDRFSLFAREENAGKTSSLGFHGQTLFEGWQVFLDHPATGSALSPEVVAYQDVFFEVHDNYIGMIAELGVFGFVAVWFLVRGLWALWRRSRDIPECRALMLGIAGVFLGMGVLHFTLRQRFAWIAVGYVVGRLQRPDRSSASGETVPESSDERHDLPALTRSSPALTRSSPALTQPSPVWAPNGRGGPSAGHASS